MPDSVATDYFNYLGVGTKQLTGGPPPPTYADFSSGKKLAITVSNDFAPYSAQLDKYPYLEYGWNLPKPIPEDLLLSFSDFVKKYKLQDLAYRIFSGGRGFANILQQLTVNVFKIVDGSYIQSNTAGKAFQPASGVNSELYDKAAAKLGSNVLFSSTVTSAQRPAKGRGGVSLVVQTPSGRKLIKASKLLITVPTLVDNRE